MLLYFQTDTQKQFLLGNQTIQFCFESYVELSSNWRLSGTYFPSNTSTTFVPSCIFWAAIEVLIPNKQCQHDLHYLFLGDREVLEEVPNDPNVLINTIMKTLEKIRLRGDLSSDTLNYFLVKDPKFARF